MTRAMYLAGNGCQKIKKQLEKDGDLTAMGKSLWNYATIGHILKNRLYCGELEYRKEYVRTTSNRKGRRTMGSLTESSWKGSTSPLLPKRNLKRCRICCQCGHAFAKTRWHAKSTDFTTYTYKCYDQTRTGTIAARLKNGMSIEGVCRVPLVQDWKIHTVAQKVFYAVFDDLEGTVRSAVNMLGCGSAGWSRRKCCGINPS